jgi:thiamine thiazole synthase
MQTETTITKAIIKSFFKKLDSCMDLDVALVGAGPSSLVAAHDLSKAGLHVAIFEKTLAPGGGIWGGGMLFNEVVVQDDALPILDDLQINHISIGQGYHTVDSIELASGLIYGARKAGAVIFNAITVEDIVFRQNRVAGLVINWTPVNRLQMHVDPLVITAKVIVDGTGHPSEVVRLATQKAGVKIDTPTGEVMGEKPMWVDQGETSTVENTKRLYPGLYAAGMAANNASGGFRMGPIFGGMLKSGRKVANLIMSELRSKQD